MTPSLEQVAGLLRVILPTLLLFLAGRGWFAPDQVGTLTSAIMDIFTATVTIVSLILSLRANSKAAQIKNVAAMPDVKVLVGPAAPPPAQVAAADANQPNVVTR